MYNDQITDDQSHTASIIRASLRSDHPECLAFIRKDKSAVLSTSQENRCMKYTSYRWRICRFRGTAAVRGRKNVRSSRLCSRSTLGYRLICALQLDHEVKKQQQIIRAASTGELYWRGNGRRAQPEVLRRQWEEEVRRRREEQLCYVWTCCCYSSISLHSNSKGSGAKRWQQAQHKQTKE